MTISKADQAAIAVRRAGLIRLRREGVRYDDPRITALGYSSVRHASKDLVRALEEARDNESAEASVYRQQENERLDALLEAVWDKATTPSPVFDKERQIIGEEIDLKAVDTVLRLMDRRAKLNGLDAPVKTEISGPDGGAVPLGSGTLAELDALINITGRAPSATPGSESRDEDAGDNSDQ
ncbi:hypothetical protein E6R18_25110 [Streptomyces sp. A1277]|nr:hypothetical protein E6R18_25110 [Streptomyces sp. A1277]